MAADEKEAVIKSMTAGSGMEMMTLCYFHALKDAVENGEIDSKLIDEATFRILQLKDKLGLFENPYHFADENLEGSIDLKEEFKQAFRKVAKQCPVLLKNQADVLLLKADFILAGSFK